MKETIGRIFLDVTPTFKVGDPCPDGYIARQEWAEVHYKAGLKQEACNSCGVWQFPHELSPTTYTTTAWNRKGEPVELKSRRCLECEKKIEKKTKKKPIKITTQKENQ